MPLSPGKLSASDLSRILQALIDTKQTGYLKMKEGEQEGFIAIENGLLLNAQTPAGAGLPALFQFVAWKGARLEFHERPIPADLPRDLAVYDPRVLIQGVTDKAAELSALEKSIPSFDSVLHYVGGEAHGAIEATPADLGLLSLADGHRSVRDIAQMVKMSPLEVARCLARFRVPGVLELLVPKTARTRSAWAAG